MVFYGHRDYKACQGRGAQGSRRDQKILEEGDELDPHFCPEEIMSREVELG